MKRGYIVIVVACLMTFCTYRVVAQTSFALNYTIGIPSGTTEDFINTMSFRGLSVDFTYALDEQIEVGLSTGWQNFYKDFGYETRNEGTQTLSSTRTNYINSIPLYATATYFLVLNKPVRPFVSVGAGTVYNQQDQNIGFYTFRSEGWQFSVRPEIGVRKELDYGFGVQALARYSYAFETTDLPEFSYYTFAIGLVWMH